MRISGAGGRRFTFNSIAVSASHPCATLCFVVSQAKLQLEDNEQSWKSERVGMESSSHQKLSEAKAEVKGAREELARAKEELRKEKESGRDKVESEFSKEREKLRKEKDEAVEEAREEFSKEREKLREEKEQELEEIWKRLEKEKQDIIAEKDQEIEEAIEEFIKEKEQLLVEKKTELEGMLANVTELRERQEEVMRTKNDKISKLSLELDEAKGENKQLRHEKGKEIAQLVEKAAGIEKVIAEGEGREEELLVYNETLRSDLKKVQESKGELESMVKKLEEEVSNGRGREVMNEEEIKLLVQEKKELMSELEINEGVAETQMRETETRLQEAMEMVDGREKVVDALTAKLGEKEREAEAVIKHLEIMNRKVKELRNANENWEGKEQRLLREIEEWKVKVDAVKRAGVKNVEKVVSVEKEGFVRELAGAGKDKRRLEKMVEDMKAKNLQLVQELEGLKLDGGGEGGAGRLSLSLTPKKKKTGEWCTSKVAILTFTRRSI